MLYSIEDKTLTTLGNTMRKYVGNYIGSKDTEIEPDIIMVLDTREFQGEIRKTSSTSLYNYYDFLCNLNNNKWEETGYLLFEIEYETNKLDSFDIILTNRYNDESLTSIATIAYAYELSGSATKYYERVIRTYFTDEYYLSIRSYRTTNEDYCRATVKIWFCDSNQQKLVPNYYTLPKAIETIDTIGLAPKITISNGAGAFYRFNNGAGAISHQLLLNNPNIFSTKNLSSNIGSMFQEATIEYIPFDINISGSSTSISMSKMFYLCEELKELPRINGNLHPTSVDGVFFGCRLIKSFPDGYFDNWNWSNLNQLTGNKSWNKFIANMYSLEYLPETLLKNYWGGYTSSSSNAYGTLVTKCWHLLECKGLAVSPQTFTSNSFTTDSFNECYMLGDFTFEVNEDGTPKTANWVNQTIDFCSNNKPIGVLDSTVVENNFLQYSDKTTKDNKVIDTNTYETYKGDKYYWTTDINYSRYNHDSAVNTINSLPDCSATGGTNTIKFKGQSGALTDAGAINTLTEEEIAVATAKGWTISFV